MSSLRYIKLCEYPQREVHYTESEGSPNPQLYTVYHSVHAAFAAVDEPDIFQLVLMLYINAHVIIK